MSTPKTFKIIIPKAPDPATLVRGGCAITDRSRERLLVYCPLNRCGAIFHMKAQLWSIEMPIDFSEFLVALETRDLLPNNFDEADLSIWIENCTSAPAAGNC